MLLHFTANLSRVAMNGGEHALCCLDVSARERKIFDHNPLFKRSISVVADHTDNRRPGRLGLVWFSDPIAVSQRVRRIVSVVGQSKEITISTKSRAHGWRDFQTFMFRAQENFG